jgi:beta-galactosidase
MVDRWWDLLLPTLAPSLYTAGGCIIMIQIENEYGSFGSDHVYLHHLLDTVREHLGNNVIIYTTDGAAVENLENGSLQGCGVYTAIDFPTGSDPSSAFALQKHYNPAGMSPPLSAEFYTGWLTHWGERIAQTDAASTASDLDHVLSLNASVVLYVRELHHMSLMLGLSFFHQGYRLKHSVDTSVRCFLYGGTGWANCGTDGARRNQFWVSKWCQHRGFLI